MNAKNDQSTTTALVRRIKKFYSHLASGEFESCYRMIDAVVRENPNSVTHHQYVTSLQTFLDAVEEFHFNEITSIELHLGEPSNLYGVRDFAVVNLVWSGKDEQRHKQPERWVKNGRSWYTRATGFVVTAPVGAR